MFAASQVLAAGLQDDAMMFDEYMDQPGFAAAWSLYAGGNYGEAYDSFSDLLRQNPIDPKINMAYALAAKKAGRFSHAALALDRILTEQPGNLRARLELAEAYYFMRQYELAEVEFESVLDAEPPAVVHDNIMSYMRLINQRTRKWRMSVRAETGAFHDDNVNVGPADALISIEPIRAGSVWIDTLSVQPESQPQEAWGFYGALTVWGEYDIGRKKGWKAFGRANAYQSILDDHNEFEMGYYQLALGVMRERSRSVFRFPFRAEHIIRGHETLVNIYGATPTYLFAVKPKVHLITTVNGEYRDYVDSSAYSGEYFSLGETARWFWGKKNHSVGLGIRALRESTNEEEYSNWSGEGSLTADYRLLSKTTMYGLGQLRMAKYDERPAMASDDREDDQWILSCGVLQRINYDWDVNLNYRYTRNHSNFDLYTYRRHVFSLNTSYTF